MLDKLIEEGEKVRQSCCKNGETVGNYLDGEDYEKWIAKCIMFMEKNHKGETLTKRFISASEQAVGNGPEFYDTMMGILKAIKDFEV